jgi:lipooligosaccharide transport system ATP-binding protein
MEEYTSNTPNNASAATLDDNTNDLVSVKGLTKHFGERQAVRGVDFFINQGECLGLLGPNGAGKTTIIQMLLGLVEKTAGNILMFGMQPNRRNLPKIKARIGVVPQNDNLDTDLTVEENLVTYGAYFNLKKKAIRNRIGELLDFFALSNRRHDIIQHLSGGQRRRLLLARALINNPEFIILDEPTIGLDPQARYLIWERLEALREQGTTMLLTSHYMDEVSRLSNRVLILDHGLIVAQGEPKQMVTDLVGIDVFEVEGSIAELTALEKAVATCQATTERTADRLYIYTREDCSRLEKLMGEKRNWIKRPANLEDLFIQLTGRNLRES